MNIKGVDYIIAVIPKGCKGSDTACDVCHCGYCGAWCRLGGANCKLKRNEYYKVADPSKKVKDGRIYELGDRYYAKRGNCVECAFYKVNLNKTNIECTLRGLSCPGNIPLKKIKKGGM